VLCRKDINSFVQIRLVAVSKLKPCNDILALHQEPHRQLDFGENYAQELTEKAALLPRSIRWHMIGALQTNKCKPLAEQVANLYCVSSVDTVKKADALEKGRAALAERQELPNKLRVLVQVNTSGEAEKSGIEPSEAASLCRHVRERCPRLQLAGLMTIGAIARSQAATSAENVNEDFLVLRQTRDKIAEELGIPKEELELSMGMSSDFEAAIAQGSDEVRVGTTIFGQRPAKKDAKIKDDNADTSS
jgi:PLP dependent protein